MSALVLTLELLLTVLPFCKETSFWGCFQFDLFHFPFKLFPISNYTISKVVPLTEILPSLISMSPGLTLAVGWHPLSEGAALWIPSFNEFFNWRFSITLGLSFLSPSPDEDLSFHYSKIQKDFQEVKLKRIFPLMGQFCEIIFLHLKVLLNVKKILLTKITSFTL